MLSFENFKFICKKSKGDLIAGPIGSIQEVSIIHWSETTCYQLNRFLPWNRPSNAMHANIASALAPVDLSQISLVEILYSKL